MIAPLLLFFALLFPQNNSGVIEGRVLRFGTTEGLASSLITITRVGQQELSGEPDAVTDASGYFAIRNASPGPYTIRASRPGYISPSENGVVLKDIDSRKITVDLENPVKVELALSPGAALAGRIFDPFGRPAENARVEAVRISNSVTGGPSISGQTDDRGQYRLWGLRAGTYRISVEYRQNGPQVIPQDSWIKTYYPGTVDSSRATPIELADSAVVEGVDFGFHLGSTFRISGFIIDPGRAKRSGVPDFYLIPLDGGETKVTAPTRVTAMTMGPPVNAQAQPDRTFELRGIPSGRYILYAEDWAMGTNLHDNFVVAQATVDVRANITDLALTMSGTAVIQGTVLDAQQRPVSGARVSLIPPEDRRSHPMFYKEARTATDGRFTIKGAMPGEYKLFAIDPKVFGDSEPLPPLHGLPAFLAPFEAQGVTVRTAAEESVNVAVTPIQK